MDSNISFNGKVIAPMRTLGNHLVFLAQTSYLLNYIGKLNQNILDLEPIALVILRPRYLLTTGGLLGSHPKIDILVFSDDVRAIIRIDSILELLEEGI
jgi:hypothetical protein